ncbi:MAG: ABC transporter ATP-binding protein [Pirellulaceae bacterium]|nr:ABC transporter ATP-binding protein [Pirellulaceae bacterium]
MIDIQGLTKCYGSLNALDDLTLEIPSGQVFGLLGPNGAGKSTLLRILLGFLRPSSGKAMIGGFDCYHESLQVRRLVAYMPGDVRMFPGLKARSTIQTMARLRGQVELETAWRVARILELDLDCRVKAMSTGMRQKLALVLTFSNNAPLLVLDEPTANLDPTMRSRVMGLVSEMGKKGQTVVFSSHVLAEIEEVCDRVGILKSGKLVHLAPLSELAQVHHLSAITTGPFPDLPPQLADCVQLHILEDQQVTLQVEGDLAPVIQWLSTAPLEQMQIEPTRLKSIYRQYHRFEQETTAGGQGDVP